MISTVRSRLPGAVNTNRSVRSRRASSPGNWKGCSWSPALKWLDTVEPPHASGDAGAGHRFVAYIPTAEKTDQRLVHLVSVRRKHAVGSARDHDQPAVLHRLLRPDPRRRDWTDPVGVTMHHERGHLELSKVAAEVGQPACRAIDGGLRGGAGSLVPAITDDLFTNALSQQRVEVVEVLVPTGQEGEPILCDRALDSLYRGLVQWPGIVGCLQQVRSNPGENRGLADASGPILADVSSHLSAAHRESDERDVTQVEPGDELVEVLGERVVVISRCGLTRLTKPTAVVGNDSISPPQQRQRLSLP